MKTIKQYIVLLGMLLLPTLGIAQQANGITPLSVNPPCITNITFTSYNPSVERFILNFQVYLDNGAGCGTSIDTSAAKFHLTSELYGSLPYSVSNGSTTFQVTYPSNLTCSRRYDTITVWEEHSCYTKAIPVNTGTYYKLISSAYIGGNQIITKGETADSVYMVVPPSVSHCNNNPRHWWQKTVVGNSRYQFLDDDGSVGYNPGILDETTYYSIQSNYPEINMNTVSGNSAVIIVKDISNTELSPSIDQNYILSYSPREPYKNIEGKPVLDLAPQIIYYDGLGRPVQDVQVHATPWYEDVVATIGYDAYGRQHKDYLPYSKLNGEGKYQSTAIADQASWYTIKFNNSTDSRNASYYRQYEQSPLNRALKEVIPGYSSPKNPTEHSYGTNTQNDDIAKWELQGRSKSTYAPNTLYKKATSSPDKRVSVTYTDMQGKVVESHQTDRWGSNKLVTSYTYDSYGRLCLVVPPKAQGSTYLNDAEWESLVYRYSYDDRGRCIIKKLPGAEPTYYVYDKADRLVLSQNGEQRNRSGEWTCYYYDRLGREVLTAFRQNYGTRENLQELFKNIVIHVEKVADQPYGYGIPLSDLPHIQENILTVTYYDDYSTLQEQELQEATGYAQYLQRPIGQVTKRLVRLLEPSLADVKLVGTAYFYDENRRTILELETDGDGGKDIVKTVYNFTGQPLSQNRWISIKNDISPTFERYTYEYDHRGRNTKLWHGLDNMADRLLATYRYDDFGRLIKKQRNDNVETTHYSYDIRERLTELRGETFSQWLAYTSRLPGESADYPLGPYYGGDIRATLRKQKGKENESNQYLYDTFGRLTRTTVSVNNSRVLNTVSYDNNGNISHFYQDTLALALSYSGNQLTRARKLYNNEYFTYQHDANGNMTYDELRGIAIRYNRLNLPKQVSKGSDTLSYSYLTNGQKRMKQLNGENMYYRSGMVFSKDGSPDYVLHPEGMAKHLGSNQWQWHYHLRDHLGNTRAVVSETGEVLQQTDYHSFGAAYALDNTDKNKYLYGGKELQDEALEGTSLNLYDFEARFFDGEFIPRFTTLDPLAEKRFNISPYSYCSNNPINRVDPNGMLDDEWEYNVNTRDLTRTGSEGGTETQYVTIVKYDDEGNKIEETSVSVNGAEVHVYPLRDATKLTNYDAELDVDTYNAVSGYIYSSRDFSERNKYRETDGVIYRGIKQKERRGNAEPIHPTEFNEKYGANAGIVGLGYMFSVGSNASSTGMDVGKGKNKIPKGGSINPKSSIVGKAIP